MGAHRLARLGRTARGAQLRRHAAPLLLLFTAGSGCQMPGPGNDVTIGQTVLELGEAVNALRFEAGVMQDQIDSLRSVVARQDSAIARLSSVER